MMGVSGLAGDPAYPPKRAAAAARRRSAQLGETLARGFNRLGWHWWPSDSAITTQEYEGRARLHQRGHVPLRLRRKARRRSTDITYWPVAHAPRRATADTLPRARDHRRTRAAWPTASSTTTRTAVERRQRAHVVVLACNGIGTPRLLLNSTSKQFPDGLANRSGLVGKNLMFHPYAMVIGIFDEPLEAQQGPTGCCI